MSFPLMDSSPFWQKIREEKCIWTGLILGSQRKTGGGV